MNFTNVHGIKSQSVIDALTTDDYDMKDRPSNVLTCTEIIDAPKAKVLPARHKDELVIDASDNFWLLDGSAVHYAVEMSNSKVSRLSEERIYLKIGEKITAHTLGEGQVLKDAEWYCRSDVFVTVKFDSYCDETYVIEDYKRTSVWESVFGIKASRMQQLNIGAFALRLLGFRVDGVRSVQFLKDWSRKDYVSQVRKSAEYNTVCKYPSIPYKEFEGGVWNAEEVEAFIRFRVSLHLTARAQADDDITPCSEDERWYRGEAYAVMKIGGAKATKVFKVEDGYSAKQAAADASDHAEGLNAQGKGKYFVEKRPGENKRCTDYCPARMFCNFGRTLVVVDEE